MPERVLLASSFVLHARPYRDTSLLLDIFTQDYGRISAIAKGARGPRSKNRGILQAFVPILLSWTRRSELAYVNQVEQAGTPYRLVGKGLISALYLNELLVRVIRQGDVVKRLFRTYSDTLSGLQGADDKALGRVLRLFEKKLLDNLGYGLPLLHEAEHDTPINAEHRYWFEADRGFVMASSARSCGSSEANVFSGRSILSLAAEDLSDTESLLEAKRLLRLALEPHLGNRPLNSRQLIVPR